MAAGSEDADNVVSLWPPMADDPDFEDVEWARVA